MSTNHRQLRKQKELDRVISKFLAGKSAPWPGQSSGTGVRLNSDTAILEWHEKGRSGREWSTVLAEWDQRGILRIPGPQNGGEKEKFRWCNLAVDGELWGVGSDEFTGNMMAYLLERAAIQVRGEEHGRKVWDSVQAAAPYPDTERQFKFLFTNSDGLIAVPFAYPFECDVDNGFDPSDLAHDPYLAIKSPAPEEVRDLLLKHASVPNAAAFLTTLKNAYTNIR